MRRTLNIAGCLLLLWVVAVAAMPSQNGLEQVKNIYRKMSSISGEGSAIYLGYTVKTTLPDAAVQKGMKTAESNVEVIIQKKYSKCTSKDMLFCQDEKDAFTVIPSRKVVYWSNSTLSLKDDRVSQLSFLRDTIFDMSTLVESKAETGKEGYTRRVVIQLNKKAQSMFNMYRLSFYIDEANSQIKKIVIAYPQDHYLSSTEMSFNKIDMNYHGPDTGKPVKAMFIQGKDKLVASYKGYTLIDNRKKK